MSQVIPLEVEQAQRDEKRQVHALNSIREALHGLRFGKVTVVVQDGVVVQVERTEKLRLRRA